MAAPGCGIIFAPSQRIDRSSSLRRSRSLNTKPKPATANKPPVLMHQSPDMAFLHTHSRSLSDKMRSLHRKKNSNESNVSKPQQPYTMLSPAKKNPKHLDLIEAASQQDPSRQCNGGRRDIGIGKENAVLGTNLSRPSISKMEQNSRKIAYDQYLSEAFGLQGLDKPKPAGVQRLKASEEVRPESDMSSRTTDSMEVLFHIHPTDLPTATTPPINPLPAKARRPHLSVMIPGSTVSAKRPRSTAHLANQIDRQKTKGKSPRTRMQVQESQSQVSPPSSTTAQTDEAPARLSVVSPLSAVQMPRPRRPFSAWSLEEMTHEVPEMPRTAPPLEKSSSSDSSDDTGDHDDDRSSNYSGRSSMSSLTEDPSLEDRSHSIAFSICSPTAAGVFDGMPLTLKNSKELRTMKNTATLAVNTNKPLPPEPGMADVAPLNVPGSTRPSSISGKRNAPSPLTISRDSTIEMSSHLPSRMSSLRSKYTPADLDALDAAFTRTSPNTQAAFYSHQEPTLSQAQMELEAHLGTIKEEPLLNPTLTPAVHDPLQISRGPNTMVPSRQAPPPPSSLKLSDGSVSSRKRLQKKSAAHVALQMRAESIKDLSESEAGSEHRACKPAPVRAASVVKANKILGKEGGVSMQREASAESSWSSRGSPQTNYDDSSSPTMSREDSSTPETDISSVPDPAFEEVRARLELLSAKNDSNHFAAWGSQYQQPEITSSVNAQSQNSEEPSSAISVVNPFRPRKDSLGLEIHITPTHESRGLQVDTVIALENADDESCIHPLRRRGTKPEELRPRSLASIAMSEIPDIYASLPSPGLDIDTARQSMTAEEVERMISADAAEKVLLRILQNLDNLQDLFATATVSRGFYRTFKRHELPLMKSALHGMSPAAWELREMSPPYPRLEGASPALDYTPSLYLQHYMRDMYTMIALKSMILIHCESFLRADTITALAGGETERASQIDDAFWRVWTFCQVFGCGSNREEDISGQMDWLRGGSLAAKQRKNANATDLGSEVDRSSVLYSSPKSFGRGNIGGLSAEDLYDMTEIWTCLGVLVRGFQGKRQEAREFGIFQNTDVTAGDIEKEDSILGTCVSSTLDNHLANANKEEWTYHLLTLAPPTVLDVTSPTSPTAATFAHARSRGYTTWTPPAVSRATFLKEAVSRVYEEKVALRHSPSLVSSPKADSPTIAVDHSTAQPAIVNDTIAARWRCARHAAEIRAKRKDPSFNRIPTSEDRPMSKFPNVIEKLDANPPPVPTIPSSNHNRTPSEEDTSKNFISALVVPSGPQVRDPVDVAVDKFVAMGFDKAKAGKALAETDTGNSIDFAAAMEWLVRERKRDVSSLMHATYRGPINGEGRSAVSPEAVIRDPVGLGLDVASYE